MINAVKCSSDLGEGGMSLRKSTDGSGRPEEANASSVGRKVEGGA